MKKKLWSIAGAAAGALALVILLVALLSVPEEEAPADLCDQGSCTVSSGDFTIEENDSALIIDRSADELTQMVIRNGTGTYTVTRNSATGLLEIAELRGLPINEDFLELVWRHSVTLGYSYVIRGQDGETPADVTQYGLAAPSVRVECSYADSTTTAFSVGNKEPGGESTYYITVDGYPGVFITDMDVGFFQGVPYWLSDDVYKDTAIEEVKIGQMHITGASFPQEVTVLPWDTADSSDPFYSYDYVMSAPFAWGCDNYTMSLLTYEIGYMNAQEAVAAYPDASVLASYGLSSPRCVLRYVRNGVQYTLYCSDVVGDSFYVRLDGTPVIYRLDTDSYTVLSKLTMETLMSREVHVRSFEAVSGITVSGPGVSYAFSVTRSPMASDPTLYEYFASCGGAPLTLNYYKNFLEVFNSAPFAGLDAQVIDSAPYMTVTVSYYPEYGRPDEVITYQPAQMRRYRCTVNGQSVGSVTSLWVEKLLADAGRLSANEAVTP